MTTTALLAVIAFLLLIIVVLLAKLLRRNTYDIFSAQMAATIQELKSETQIHREVNAVLELMKGFEKNPTLIGKLHDFSRQVVGAALLYRVNRIASDLKAELDRLSSYRSSSSFASEYQISKCEALIERLTQQLHAANASVTEFQR